MASKEHEPALRWLEKQDPKLAALIESVGPCLLRRQGGSFALLAKSILSQQISVAAARTIRGRLLDQLPGRRLTAASVVALDDDQLAEAGVSAQKRRYLRDLAERVVAGEVNFRSLAQSSDEVVIESLTKVTGIGVWTAQMFLMFGLGRPDVFAPDDLGLKNAICRLYGMADPDKEELLAVAEHWSPYRSVASWYLWRSLDLPDTA